MKLSRKILPHLFAEPLVFCKSHPLLQKRRGGFHGDGDIFGKSFPQGRLATIFQGCATVVTF